MDLIRGWIWIVLKLALNIFKKKVNAHQPQPMMKNCKPLSNLKNIQ